MIFFSLRHMEEAGSVPNGSINLLGNLQLALTQDQQFL